MADTTSEKQTAGGDVTGGLPPMSMAVTEDQRCTCGKDRDFQQVEFQCAMCSRFNHKDCISSFTGPVAPFMTNYQFFCKRCNASGQDSFQKKPASFSQMCHTSIANLLAKKPDAKFFSRDKDIIPFIDMNWEKLTTVARRVKQTWHTTIGRTMMNNADIFTLNEENPNDPCFGLVLDNLKVIGPNCEALFKLVGAFKTASEPKAPAPKAPPTEVKSRGYKRKAAGDRDSVPLGRPKKGEVNISAKITPTGYPLEHPYNKDGYRYILAEPDPHAPNWEAFDQSMEWAGKPIPGYLYRTWLGDKVLLALHDRANQLKVSDDRLHVTGEKGYSMMRATHGVSHGAWYFEVIIKEMPEGSAARIGWSQALGNLQAPCGYDKFSYSWRSKKGTKFHQSIGKHYSDGGFKERDIIGFHLYMPESDDNSSLTPAPYKENPLVKFKNHLYYEDKDYVKETEQALKPRRGSQMTMYKNGRNQGVAFEDVYGGVYYPAISLYKNVQVKVNFGPRFKFAPKDCGKFKPIQECAFQSVIEHTVGDMLFHVEHEGNLPEF